MNTRTIPTRRWPALVAAMLFLSGPALGDTLETDLQYAAAFADGSDPEAMVRIGNAVTEALNGPATERLKVEGQLLKALTNASTRPGRGFLCRQLRIIGTERSVAPLEALLTDPESSHMARYALAAMEYPAAGAALHRALGKSSGAVQAGIVDSLAGRRHRDALDDIAALLSSSDSRVGASAARALGFFGGNKAVRALNHARTGASSSMIQTIDNALLRCADQFLAANRRRRAANLFNRFFTGPYPPSFRRAGLRGIAAARGAEAVPTLVQAVRDASPDLQVEAIAILGSMSEPAAAEALTRLLDSPPNALELIIRALGSRGHTPALAPITRLLGHDQSRVRLAALEAVGSLGDTGIASTLAEAAATSEGHEQQIARISLQQLRGGQETDRLLAASLPDSEGSLQAEIIRALANRGAHEVVAPAIQFARADDESVRRESIRALGLLAGENQLPELIALAKAPEIESDQASIESAIGSVFARVPSPADRAAPVLAALPDSAPDGKAVLIRLMSKAATAETLRTARKALASPNETVRNAAVRTLADWPDPGPIADLRALAMTDSSKTRKVIALRGYIRLASATEDPEAMYRDAAAIAERPDEMKLILAGLGKSGSSRSLDLIDQSLENEALRNEAASAAAQIANRHGTDGNQTEALRSTLRTALAATTHNGIRRQVENALKTLD